ncbi:peptidylprolyl isomerase [Candidatus Berkelbacteria bacterium]|nr:peptidylprolyl isomerase [Candidatus Berkelbacteria bacterium]MBI4030006.1 peptidylprolyl isomerase [Candidatus Berkelbacteria bacterium]
MFEQLKTRLINWRSRLDIYALKNRWQFKRQHIIILILALYLIWVIIWGVAIFGRKVFNEKVIFAAYTFPYPAAFINGRPLFLTEFYRHKKYVLYFSSQTKQTPPSDKEILDTLIKDDLIRRESAKKGIRIASAEVESTFEQIAKDKGGKEQILKVLEGLYKMKESDFKRLIKKRIYEERFRSEVLVNVKARHIMMGSESEANEILEKVKKGEDFAELAKKFSKDASTKDKGGDLGWFSRDTYPAELEGPAFELKAGEVYPKPSKSPLGWHVIKTEERRGSIDLNFNQWFSATKQKSVVWRLVD